VSSIIRIFVFILDILQTIDMEGANIKSRQAATKPLTRGSNAEENKDGMVNTKSPTWPGTGLPHFDAVIDGLRAGDNVVWQVDDIEEYAYFVGFFVKRAIEDGKKVVYMRFAQHRPLVVRSGSVKVYELDARTGFESFSTDVHNIATSEGEGTYYVFDSLSDLLSAWATDLMIGNFFRITCPYLFQLDTLAYFALLRNSHSFRTVARIRETTQLLLDVYNTGTDLYVHPLKARGRHSPTMFLPHKKKGDRFIPVTRSVDAARVLTYISAKGREQAKRNLDYWDRLFLGVEELLQTQDGAPEKEQVLEQLCQIMIGRDPRILDLAKKNLSLDDLLAIKRRLIGTGYIGGKAAGMLISRKMLTQDRSLDWGQYLEPHDSFFIGSDVFYTYIVENGWWGLRVKQKTREGYFEVAGILREQMLRGSFPDEIDEQFWQLIEYFGQSPIIVRSSSLLEDAFGNAFAGKYESIFLVNQGPPEQRHRQFRDGVRRIYASTMNEDALAYRLQRGLDQQDEQMALLVQRVSGSYRSRYFFPDFAGVGISYNTFVWKPDLNRRAGMLRLVLGLGTRAVNRVENDYPRIVALDAPLLKPHAGLGDTRRYSQHDVDVLNIEENKLQTVPASTIMTEEMRLDLDLVGVRDLETRDLLRERGKGDAESWIITFDKLLSESKFPDVMRLALQKLDTAYQYPVDIEFTVNMTSSTNFQINLVQCRPLQTKGEGKRVSIPEAVDPRAILFKSSANFMGGNVVQRIRRVVHVDGAAYSALSVTERYDVARLIGKLNKQISDREGLPTLLMGPGRWGTTSPSLGVPVRFSEINNISVMVEVEYATGSLVPELSFGTHFFQDLVETDIFYAAVFPGKNGAIFNDAWMEGLENLLPTLVPDAARYASVVRVYDVGKEVLYLMADIVSQTALCFSASKTDQ
jgi:hypothetical protein